MIRWVAMVVVLCVSMMAHAQETTTPTARLDPTASLFLELVKGGGMPAVVALLAWQLRGVIGRGVPVEVRLSDEDRMRLDRALDLVDRRRSFVYGETPMRDQNTPPLGG